jgi:hypothetical protein
VCKTGFLSFNTVFKQFPAKEDSGLLGTDLIEGCCLGCFFGMGFGTGWFVGDDAQEQYREQDGYVITHGLYQRDRRCQSVVVLLIGSH